MNGKSLELDIQYVRPRHLVLVVLAVLSQLYPGYQAAVVGQSLKVTILTCFACWRPRSKLRVVASHWYTDFPQATCFFCGTQICKACSRKYLWGGTLFCPKGGVINSDQSVLRGGGWLKFHLS